MILSERHYTIVRDWLLHFWKDIKIIVEGVQVSTQYAILITYSYLELVRVCPKERLSHSTADCIYRKSYAYDEQLWGSDLRIQWWDVILRDTRHIQGFDCKYLWEKDDTVDTIRSCLTHFLHKTMPPSKPVNTCINCLILILKICCISLFYNLLSSLYHDLFFVYCSTLLLLSKDLSNIPQKSRSRMEDKVSIHTTFFRLDQDPYDHHVESVQMLDAQVYRFPC